MCFIYQDRKLAKQTNLDNWFQGKKKKYTFSDAGWSKWADWSSCSVTCGIGQRHRHRECVNPTPSVFSQYCEGAGKETELCNRFPCNGAYH